MTHDELLAKINKPQALSIQYTGLASEIEILTLIAFRNALCAVVELHKPFDFETEDETFEKVCQCQLGVIGDRYPCPTIRAIEIKLA